MNRLLDIEDRELLSYEIEEAIIVMAKELSNINPTTMRSNLRKGHEQSIESVIHTIGLIIQLGKELEIALEREANAEDECKNN